MTLVDEGKVSLDDPVKKYLPEFADVWVAVERDAKHVLLERPKREITVRHVLSHTSGLPFRSPRNSDARRATLTVGVRTTPRHHWSIPGGRLSLLHCRHQHGGTDH